MSESVFNKNVMVEVATKESENPVHVLGEYLKIPLIQQFQSKLSLPLKLIMPDSHTDHYAMLGLGDIALPGMLVAYALRCDHDLDVCDLGSHHHGKRMYLFPYCLLCYVLGLLFAFYTSVVWKHAQPALIYLVPAVVIPLVIRAYFCGRLSLVWNGVKTRE
jgi:hypothetical protein